MGNNRADTLVILETWSYSFVAAQQPKWITTGGLKNLHPYLLF